MPNEAKLGLVFGVGLVIVAGVVFFRKDLASATAAPETPGHSARPASTAAPPAPAAYSRAAPAKTMVQSQEVAEDDGKVRYHTVQAGDSLYALAQRYYGDGDKFVEIYRVNRRVLRTPDSLAPGMVLIIPSLVEEQPKGIGRR